MFVSSTATKTTFAMTEGKATYVQLIIVLQLFPCIHAWKNGKMDMQCDADAVNHCVVNRLARDVALARLS